MGTMDALIRYWPVVIFILTVAFVLGGYAVMIISLKEQVKVLFDRSKNRDTEMNRIDRERAVLENELKNMKEIMQEAKGMIISILGELRGGGHTRQDDKP